MTAEYPAIIRAELERHRDAGRPFEQAWGYTIADHPTPDQWSSCMDFMQRHMKAAYYGDESHRGRCTFPGPEAGGPWVRRVGGWVNESKPERPEVEPRCCWGEGCDRTAVRGRFGPTWCDAHGAVLAAIAADCGAPVFDSVIPGTKAAA